MFFLGCAFAATLTGVVHVEDSRVLLEGMRSEWVLVPGEFTALASLHDCTLEVEGFRLGRNLYVRDWRVLDTPYGSSGYVGVLISYGAQIAIEDRNTGSLLVLAPESGEAVRAFLDHTVLIVGPVVGSRQIQVVAFRVLD
jgi:hypothetical protein